MRAMAKLPARKIRVILADDHPVVRDGLAAIVNQQADMEVVAEALGGRNDAGEFRIADGSDGEHRRQDSDDVRPSLHPV